MLFSENLNLVLFLPLASEMSLTPYGRLILADGDTELRTSEEVRKIVPQEITISSVSHNTFEKEC